MKANIICSKCGLDQTIDINPGEIWDTKCPNCSSVRRTVMAKKEPLNKSDQNVLIEASAIINGERLDTYGKPENSFKIIAQFWRTYIAARPEPLNALDVAHMMTLFKLARLLGQQSDRDNYRDACGYLAIAADRLSSNRNS